MIFFFCTAGLCRHPNNPKLIVLVFHNTSPLIKEDYKINNAFICCIMSNVCRHGLL